ncbi:TRNA (guanosine(18)-2'-O)-methyltransferase [Actinidia chinensis var. chinensis]|uniref:tRNA (Guanosine(18)-2'-O)-methyltransferase n=1 Tax=Actinidia chinensis var. chinensis TaxID=1590841 RepID=A0A2R6RKD0_ACTCC|nr:TRNA (guanosine(18)-2'-O)-methyltransferase [Actinidia chinensis var. chinensis]
MSACKTLTRSSFSCIESNLRINGGRRFSSASLRFPHSVPTNICPNFWFSSLLSRNRGFREFEPHIPRLRRYGCVQRAVSIETSECRDEPITPNLTLETPEDSLKDTVEELLSNKDDITKLMKMERRPEFDIGGQIGNPKRWFPYLDEFKVGSVVLSSGEVLEAMDPYILEARKERFRKVANNRSYAVCLVVEGLSDFGNVSAAFRSADALGFQSVHVVSCDSSKRYRDNRHVSMGAEKWLDIELWDSTQDCFKILKSRGYRIATTHVGIDAVSIYDMDWSFPTAIVVGNETRGISEEALELSDLHCSIPMNGMVDSFNVSVAAGILMHHAVSDRTTRLGCHGDLTLEENQILLAEFSLRHSKSAISIAHEYARRKAWPKL